MVPVADFVAPSAAALIVTPPSPRAKGVFTVTLAPAASVGIVSPALLPTKINTFRIDTPLNVRHSYCATVFDHY